HGRGLSFAEADYCRRAATAPRQKGSGRRSAHCIRQIGTRAGSAIVPVAATAIVVILIPVLVDVMDIDGDAAVRAAANALAHRRDVAARADNRDGRHLRYIDLVAL